MGDKDVISTDTGSGRAAPIKRRGFMYNWGPQAWINMWMSNSMRVKKAMPIINPTFVPNLCLSCDNRDQLEADYIEIKSRRETIKIFEASREKSRKRYRNFVREMEWALLELRKYFNQTQFEDIVVGTSVTLSHDNTAGFLDMMNSISDKNKPKKNNTTQKRKSTDPSWFTSLMFEIFNPAGWLTGPAKIITFDPDNGLTVMEKPECGWHVCVSQDSLLNPNALPEEGCLYILKGPFEDFLKAKTAP
jgi:hypothetical protein